MHLSKHQDWYRVSVNFHQFYKLTGSCGELSPCLFGVFQRNAGELVKHRVGCFIRLVFWKLYWSHIRSPRRAEDGLSVTLSSDLEEPDLNVQTPPNTPLRGSTLLHALAYAIVTTR